MKIFNIQNVFSEKLELHSNFKEFDNLSKIIINNRKSLSIIDSWIDDKSFEKSVYKYGIPDEIKGLINLPINNEPIYTDYIVAYSKMLEDKCNYLELGISVGKNFFQLLNSFNNSKLTSIDIEEINPILEEQLKFIDKMEYVNMPGSIKKNNFSRKQYTFKNNQVEYFSADIWDENTWQKLAGQKFNLIFSDALHDPKAILFEYKMLEKYDLLDDQFIYFWDDLVGDMQKAYLKIAQNIKTKYGNSKSTFHLVKVNGWLGQNYPLKHDVGLIIKNK